jgi:hypothetical protein
MLSCQTPPQSVKCIAQVGATVDELAVTVAAIFFQYYGVPNFLASALILKELVWVALQSKVLGESVYAYSLSPHTVGLLCCV